VRLEEPGASRDEAVADLHVAINRAEQMGATLYATRAQRALVALTDES